MNEEKIIWQPIEDGYPEETKLYLVTVGTGYPEYVVTTAAWKYDSQNGGAFYLTNSSISLVSCGFYVRAWAELPAPYSEG